MRGAISGACPSTLPGPHAHRLISIVQVDRLEGELLRTRSQSASAEGLRVREREELVRSYERMLGDQTIAARQHEAKAAAATAANERLIQASRDGSDGSVSDRTHQAVALRRSVQAVAQVLCGSLEDAEKEHAPCCTRPSCR